MVTVLLPRGKEASGMAMANHSHLAQGTAIPLHPSVHTEIKKDRYKTKTEPCQLNTSKTVLMICYWQWNGRWRNISQQYIRYYI